MTTQLAPISIPTLVAAIHRTLDRLEELAAEHDQLVAERHELTHDRYGRTRRNAPDGVTNTTLADLDTRIAAAAEADQRIARCQNILDRIDPDGEHTP